MPPFGSFGFFDHEGKRLRRGASDGRRYLRRFPTVLNRTIPASESQMELRRILGCASPCRVNLIGKPVVTQRMIANGAKVHTSTVSLALRNDPRLPEETRRRIREVARRMGYLPNPLVSALMAQVSRRKVGYRGTLAYLHTIAPDDPQYDYRVYCNYREGAELRANELGYELARFHLGVDGMSGARVEGVWHARRVAGVVIEHVPGPSCANRTLPMDVSAWPASVIGAPLGEPRLNYVANDHYMRPVVAALELLALGYRRLGLVLTHPGFDGKMGHRCSAGFWALGRYVEELVALPICQLDALDARRLGAWFKRHRPDAVLVNDARALDLIEKMGRRVPEEVGVVHLDWQPHFKPMAGVYGNSDRIGALAVDLVVSQIQRGERGFPLTPINQLVSGTWKKGTTVTKVGPPLDLAPLFFSDFVECGALSERGAHWIRRAQAGGQPLPVEASNGLPIRI